LNFILILKLAFHVLKWYLTIKRKKAVDKRVVDFQRMVIRSVQVGRLLTGQTEKSKIENNCNQITGITG
jgi:hypothetical protein